MISNGTIVKGGDSHIPRGAASSMDQTRDMQDGLLEANLTIFWLLFTASLVFFQQVG